MNTVAGVKKLYPIELQKEILQEAIELIRKKYVDDPTILAIYLSGSTINGTFGEYSEPVHQDGVPRLGSDIDVMLVMKNRYGSVLLSEEEQKRYGVRHIFVGRTEEIPVYRMVDEKGQDIFLHGKHPLEPMIITKALFEGWLSGKNEWGGKIPFPELVRDSSVIKETEDLKEIRERYTVV